MRWMGRGFPVVAELALLACGAGEGSPAPKVDAAGPVVDATAENDAAPGPFEADAAPREADAAPPEPDAGPEPESPWAALPDGCFSMGSPDMPGTQPVREVCVGAFEMSRTEVTNAEYQRCVDAGACDPTHADDDTCWVFGGDTWTQAALGREARDADRPVVCVDWFQARAYAAFAGGRLPSESEWEYAARSGGGERVYPWGDEYPDCSRTVMTLRGASCEAEHTAPPCSRPQGHTMQGACDLAGNVWEWVSDTWRPDFTGAPTDGSAVFDDGVEARVVRGGGWQTNNADYLRTRYRDDEPAGIAYDFLGLRIVR